MRFRAPVLYSILALLMIIFVTVASMPGFLRISLGVLLVVSIVVGAWALRLAPLLSPPKRKATHQFVLESIPHSHYVEKVRWCLDLAGASYEEETNVAILGVFLTGRRVPQLRVLSPDARPFSVCGSANCTRALLGGLQRDGKDVEGLPWLQITPKIAELESRLDRATDQGKPQLHGAPNDVFRFGVYMQKIFYSYYIPTVEADPGMMLHIWGMDEPRVPGWQKQLVRILLPVLVKFISKPYPPSEGPAAQVKAETVLFELESMLSDGRRYILGSTFTYADIVLASMLSLWALTGASRKLFAGRQGNVLADSRVPQGLGEWHTRTQQAYPLLFEMVLRIYSQHRLPVSKR